MRGITLAVTSLGLMCAPLSLSQAFAAPQEANSATDAIAAGQALSLEAIYGAGAVKMEANPVSKWMGEGDAYTLIEKSPRLADGFDIVRYDARSGKRSILVDAQKMVPQGGATPLKITDYIWSPDHNHLMLYVRADMARRNNPLGEYWLLDLKKGGLRQLSAGQPSSDSLIYAEFSPDGKQIAYVRANNLFVEGVAGGAPVQLTADGSDMILNGRSDVAYEEEFGLGKAFAWSPDSSRIAYWRFDTNGVGTFSMISNTDGVYSRVIPQRYPKVGTTISAVKVGVISATGGNTTWFAVQGDPRQHYTPRMSWAGGSDEVLIQHENRLQNRNEVLLGKAADGSVRLLFADEDRAWVNINEDPQWLDGGRAFTWLSERDGWWHLYVVSREDGRMDLRTPGDFDVVSVQNIDPASGTVSYSASPDNVTQRYLYRASLSGAPRMERLTPENAPGTHDYDIAPGGKWAFHSFSRFDTPTVTDLVSLPDHKSARIITGNQAMHRFLNSVARNKAEFFQVDAGDGTMLDAWMIKPPAFDPAKKYPMLVYVYSEPAGQTVADRWGGDRYLWHLMLAQQGYLVTSIDSRGAASPRGRAWRKSVYRQIGLLASADQAGALRSMMAARPYIDPARIGVWGWSGGGAMTMNAMFRYPDLYRMGIAVAGPADQLLYNAIYQERYMGLPDDNADGYFKGSPINFAQNLKGDLLIVHGTGDDNVHYQNAEQLVDRLIAFNKRFSMMSYPGRGHGISEKPGTRLHLFTTITDYLHDHLPLNSSSGGVSGK
ncbi:MAG: S9 family peptidase [Sphingobium sp.]|nr:S9 family peptidase [Sphingobium sp.]